MRNNLPLRTREFLSSMALERQHLVDELRDKGISDERVLDAINHVPREHFLDNVLRHRAYEDNALPIAEGQTISQPYTVAYQSEKLQLGRGEKVLEIGTGCGYQTAVLVEMGCRVWTIERHPKLLEIARRNLDDLGYADRVVSRAGDGTRGWPDFAPFDAIIVTAGAPDVPETLTKQLNPDAGRMIIPVGGREVQTMYLIRKTKGELSGEELKDFAFVPLIGKEGWQG